MLLGSIKMIIKNDDKMNIIGNYKYSFHKR